MPADDGDVYQLLRAVLILSRAGDWSPAGAGVAKM
jgi:hypothetical protein